MTEILLLAAIVALLLLALEPAHRRARRQGPIASGPDPDRPRLTAEFRAIAQHLR